MNQTRIKLCFISFALLLFGGFGSCGVPLKNFCEEKIPVFISSVVAAQPELSHREIASQEKNEKNLMNDSDRKNWELWAENHLFEIQRVADSIEEEVTLRTLRLKLSDIAKELVFFHGYSHAGDTKKMLFTLKRINDQALEVKTTHCAL